MDHLRSETSSPFTVYILYPPRAKEKADRTCDQPCAPQVGLEPTTTRLTAGCSAIELLRNMKSGKTRQKGSGSDLSSRAVSSQVLSALKSLTAVFGMGTGGTSSSLPPEMVLVYFSTIRLRCQHIFCADVQFVPEIDLYARKNQPLMRLALRSPGRARTYNNPVNSRVLCH